MMPPPTSMTSRWSEATHCKHRAEAVENNRVFSASEQLKSTKQTSGFEDRKFAQGKRSARWARHDRGFLCDSHTYFERQVVVGVVHGVIAVRQILTRLQVKTFRKHFVGIPFFLGSLVASEETCKTVLMKSIQDKDLLVESSANLPDYRPSLGRL